jgi:N-acetylmuramoyl-L-alanine amidase
LVHFDRLPVVQVGKQVYVTTAALAELSPAAPANPATGKPLGGKHESQDEEPEEHAGAAPGLAAGSGSGYAGMLEPTPAALPPLKAGRNRCRLAGHAIDLAVPGTPLAGELDGKPLDGGALLEHAGATYISAKVLAKAGLLLGFDGVEDAYQLVGLVYSVEYSGAAVADRAPSLVMRCLTPLSAETAQDADGTVNIVLHGGFFADTAPREFAGDAAVSRVGFKTQPELGRSYVFIKQPRQTGVRVTCDPRVGFARVSFGNYLQLVDYSKSSSGEISLHVQLGAPCAARGSFVDNPPRIVVDFPGAIYKDASQSIKVEQGGVHTIRVGTPEPGTVRVVLDLAEALDYRVLSKNGGAKYYIQLLPRAQVGAPLARRRLGRTIMLDPGHGGTDPGAPGVFPGVNESALTLQIVTRLAAELRKLDYDVLLTRTSDRFISLGARTDYANGVLPYIFVSVHCNSIEDPAFQGLMTFCHPASLAGRRLAGLVHQEVLSATGAVDKGVRTADFLVLRETAMPSILVECGFVTNAAECRELTDPQYQQLIAQGIARGIDRYVTGGL